MAGETVLFEAEKAVGIKLKENVSNHNTVYLRMNAHHQRSIFMNLLKFFLITSVVAGHHYCNKNVDLHHYSVAVIFCLLLIHWQDFSLTL